MDVLLIFVEIFGSVCIKVQQKVSTIHKNSKALRISKFFEIPSSFAEKKWKLFLTYYWIFKISIEIRQCKFSSIFKHRKKMNSVEYFVNFCWNSCPNLYQNSTKIISKFHKSSITSEILKFSEIFPSLAEKNENFEKSQRTIFNRIQQNILY